MNHLSFDQMMLAVCFLVGVISIRMLIRQIIRIINTLIRGCLIWFSLIIALLAFIYFRYAHYFTSLNDADSLAPGVIG